MTTTKKDSINNMPAMGYQAGNLRCRFVCNLAYRTEIFLTVSKIYGTKNLTVDTITEKNGETNFMGKNMTEKKIGMKKESQKNKMTENKNIRFFFSENKNDGKLLLLGHAPNRVTGRPGICGQGFLRFF